jgi:hypothetical protein
LQLKGVVVAPKRRKSTMDVGLGRRLLRGVRGGESIGQRIGKTFGRSLSLWYKARAFLATKSLTPSDTFDGVLDTR